MENIRDKLLDRLANIDKEITLLNGNGVLKKRIPASASRPGYL
jgi:hypothetical protein